MLNKQTPFIDLQVLLLQYIIKRHNQLNETRSVIRQRCIALNFIGPATSLVSHSTCAFTEWPYSTLNTFALF